ncbi:MAG: glycosyl hydrolase 53 family protein [Prevotella sp.]|nr:glycosyl hydrolase 53 family protein [Prevotella sp.]
MRKTVIATLMCAFPLIIVAQKWLGGDVSLLPTYEKNRTEYFDFNGNATPATTIFRQEGWNMMRVRLFVDPQNAPEENKGEGVCQDLPYVIALSKRLKSEGFKLMLDLHYSDTWADPGKQFTPKRWKKLGKQTLCDSIYSYTCNVLKALKANNIMPDMIQVGNEITFGMLWPTGRVEPTRHKNWKVLGQMLRAGSRSCREICPEAKIIIHTEHIYDWEATKAYYSNLSKLGVDYDIIGLSYYPMWHKDIGLLGKHLSLLEEQFPDKPVMIVETAFYYSHENDVWESDPNHYSDLFPISKEGQAAFTRELVEELNQHKNVTGLFWWFPEENESGKPVIKSWINRGLFDNRSGKVLPALKEMKQFLK